MPARDAITRYLLVILLLGCGSAAASDDPKPTGVVRDRIDAMKAMKVNVKLIADMVRGRTRFDAQELTAAALEIADEAPRIPEYFPAGSLQPPSNALPAIWQKMDRFERLSEQLQHTAQLIAADASDNDIRRSKQQFRELGRACADCHKQFRQKQENYKGL